MRLINIRNTDKHVRDMSRCAAELIGLAEKEVAYKEGVMDAVEEAAKVVKNSNRKPVSELLDEINAEKEFGQKALSRDVQIPAYVKYWHGYKEGVEKAKEAVIDEMLNICDTDDSAILLDMEMSDAENIEASINSVTNDVCNATDVDAEYINGFSKTSALVLTYISSAQTICDVVSLIDSMNLYAKTMNRKAAKLDKTSHEYMYWRGFAKGFCEARDIVKRFFKYMGYDERKEKSRLKTSTTS